MGRLPDVLGAGLAGAGTGILSLLYYLSLLYNSRWYDTWMGVVGFALVAAGMIILLYAPYGRRLASIAVATGRRTLSMVRKVNVDPQLSHAGSPRLQVAEAERYARLLSRLEDLRKGANLPKPVYSKLEEEYVQQLRIALETEETQVAEERFCENCGANVPANTKYCPKCGVRRSGVSFKVQLH